jgi:hypothetical protein
MWWMMGLSLSRDRLYSRVKAGCLILNFVRMIGCGVAGTGTVPSIVIGLRVLTNYSILYVQSSLLYYVTS